MASTMNYDKFTLLNFNREKINERHVGRIKTSILKNGYLKSNPIIVNEKYEILDGQHRFTACRELGLPICFEVVKEEDKKDLIITLNNTQKKWVMNDYINYYAVKHQKEDYMRLQALCKSSKVAPTVILQLCNDRVAGSNVSARVARGDLKFALEDEMNFINFYNKVRLIADSLRMKISARFVDGIISLSRKEGFDWNVLLHKAKLYPTKAYPCITKEDYIVMLRDLYNYNSKTNRIQ